jgi:hypothetical protein
MLIFTIVTKLFKNKVIQNTIVQIEIPMNEYNEAKVKQVYDLRNLKI